MRETKEDLEYYESEVRRVTELRDKQKQITNTWADKLNQHLDEKTAGE